MIDVSGRSALMAAITAMVDRAFSQRQPLAAVAESDFPGVVASWPETRAINEIAAVVARAHGYLCTEADEDETGDQWGRRLNRRTLSALGVCGVLREPAVPDRFPAALAGYLVGPVTSSEHMIVLDLRLYGHTAYELAGWRLSQPTPEDLDSMTPIPSACRFAADPWDPALRAGGCWVLRRTAKDLEPRDPSVWPRDVMSDLFDPHLVVPAWEPLLLLNLAQPERVVVAAEYEIEPGRMVERVRGTGLGLVPGGGGDAQGYEEWEEPAWGPCRLNRAETLRALAFAEVMSPLLNRWQAWEAVAKQDRKAVRQAYERLYRSTQGFLAIGPRLGARGDVLRERERAEVIFWFVSALEHLLITDHSSGELARKVSQRAAILIGTEGNERVEIRRAIARAYGIRSQVAHGALPRDADLKTLPRKLYGYLRRLFRNLIILGPLFNIADICDDAMMSAAVRQQQITSPIQSVIGGG